MFPLRIDSIVGYVLVYDLDCIIFTCMKWGKIVFFFPAKDIYFPHPSLYAPQILWKSLGKKNFLSPLNWLGALVENRIWVGLFWSSPFCPTDFFIYMPISHLLNFNSLKVNLKIRYFESTNSTFYFQTCFAYYSTF